MKYQDLIDACRQDWQEYTEHAFVQQLAKGTLAQPCFLHYLKQIKEEETVALIHKTTNGKSRHQSIPNFHRINA